MNAITWQQTNDRRTWRAARGPVVLTVSKLTNVEVPGVAERSPEFRTRLGTQGWANNRAGVSR